MRILGLLSAVVFWLPSVAWSATPAGPPNILLITIDTLRADRLGCYGYKQAQTPVIDALAHEGVVFERGIAQVPLTWPSHVVILTGTYPFSNGVQDFTGQPLSPGFRTLAESFRDQGYAAGAVVSAFVLDRSWGLARGFDFYYDAFSGLAFAQRDIGLVDRRAQESVDRALEWLAGVRHQPFFLWLHLFDPHSPYDPPEPFRSRFRQRPYDGEVAYVDEQLGRLMDWLKQEGLYESTVIVLVGDHGESLGDHGEAEHGFFIYNATLRVPFIIKPASGTRIRPRRVPVPVETLSVPPTLLHLAALQDPIQKQFQGESLVGLMAHGQGGRRVAYAETFYPFSSFGWSPLRSLQTERYHYIEAPVPELYDLRADPREKVNLASRESQRVRSLRAQLQDLIGRYQPPPPPQEKTPGPGAEAAEKLRTLGYVAYRAPAPDSANLSDPKSRLGEYKTILEASDAFRAGRYQAGRSLLKKLQETDPKLYLIPFMLGEAASRQGDWAAAVEEFKRCLELNPGFDEAMIGLGRALHMNGKSDLAQEWLRRALELNPQNFRAWYELARAQMRDDPRAAAASLEKVLAIQPNFAPAYRDRGLLEMKEEKYAEASRSLARAVELGLEDPATYNYLGITYSRTNQLDLAVESYRRALAADPNFAQAHLNLAYAYQRLNQPAAARQEYETACRLDRNLCQYVPDPRK